MNKFISEENFYIYLAQLQQNYKVLLPQQKGSSYLFSDFTDNSKIKFDYPTTIIPPSKLFLPSKETIFSFKNNQIIKPVPPKIAIVGISYYDLSAIAILDKIYANDSNYSQRRQNSIIIGYKRKMGCDLYQRKPSINYLDSADLIFEETDGGYIFSSLRRTSEDLLDFNIFEKTSKRISDPQICPDPVFSNIQKLSYAVEKSLPSRVWKNLARRCFLCGNCSYVCPLCYCYEIEDRNNLDGKSGKRYRRWDSCFLPEFAQICGGYNFRSKKWQRIYHWYFHKFVRAPFERNGLIDCIGCNRCTIYCPAKINFREELGKILEEYE